jgi:chromosome segregation ATPase
MPSAFEKAMTRLEAAVELIEGAVDGRFEEERKVADAESELHRLGTDRSRLAQSLDTAEARAARLEEANRDVSRRLVAAMEAIKGVLDRSGGG